MSCNPEVLQFTLSPQTNLLKIHCRRFLQSHSRIKLKLIIVMLCPNCHRMIHPSQAENQF